MYFVTICTQNKECLFGEIKNGEMILNEYGEIIKFTWFDLINHNICVLLDSFVVMPNHIHGIIVINDKIFVGAGSKPALIKINQLARAGLEPAPTKLSEIVRQFKTFSAKRINKLRNTPGLSVWQRDYYEHIIRNDRSLEKICDYIINNPCRWNHDELFINQK